MTSNELEDICNRLTNETYNKLYLEAIDTQIWLETSGFDRYTNQADNPYPDYFQIWLDTWNQLQLEYADVIRPISRRERKKRAYHERYAQTCKSAC